MRNINVIKKYHIEYLLQFRLKILHDSLDDVDIYKKRFDEQQLLSESARNIFVCFKEHLEIRLG